MCHVLKRQWNTSFMLELLFWPRRQRIAHLLYDAVASVKQYETSEMHKYMDYMTLYTYPIITYHFFLHMHSGNCLGEFLQVVLSVGSCKIHFMKHRTSDTDDQRNTTEVAEYLLPLATAPAANPFSVLQGIYTKCWIAATCSRHVAITRERHPYYICLLLLVLLYWFLLFSVCYLSSSFVPCAETSMEHILHA